MKPFWGIKFANTKDFTRILSNICLWSKASSARRVLCCSLILDHTVDWYWDTRVYIEVDKCSESFYLFKLIEIVLNFQNLQNFQDSSRLSKISKLIIKISDYSSPIRSDSNFSRSKCSITHRWRRRWSPRCRGSGVRRSLDREAAETEPEKRRKIARVREEKRKENRGKRELASPRE